MYDELGSQADFYIVYIAEAHTIDGWQTASNEQEGIRIRQATTFAERLAAAQLCAANLALTIPTLVDDMDNAAFEAFSAWPERIYIVNAEGRIHYRGGPGPFEFKPQEARTALELLLEAEEEKGNKEARKPGKEDGKNS
jgi:hypothetical protein